MDEGKEGDSRLTALSDAKRSSVEPQYYSTYRELQLRILYYSYVKKHRSCWELVRSLLATCSKVLVWEILNCYRTHSNSVSQISIYACCKSAILQAVCPFFGAKDPHILNPQK